MSVKYLAIEKDEKFHEQESTFWLSHGVDSIRVSSMTEGIKEAMNQPFLYIGINATNINYKPQLPILREATNDPIFISTTTYTMQEQGEAVSLGADLFGQIGEKSNDNYETVMANIRALQERATRRKPPAQLIPRNNILISPKRREVFVSDKEIKLTKIEFDLLYFLTNNRGIALSSEQIYNKVWKNDRAESVDAVVKSAINRLRKKIDLDENKNSLIENLWGVGYRLPTDFDK